MIMRARHLLTLLALVALAQAETVSPDPKLESTGSSARRKFFVKVYDITHYAEPPLHGDVFQHAGLRRVEMVFALAIAPGQLKTEIRRSLQDRTTPEMWMRLQKSLQAFEDPITTGVRSGDTFTLDWWPDGTLVSRFGDKELGRIQDPDFAAALWGLWLGPQSLVDRDALLRSWRRP